MAATEIYINKTNDDEISVFNVSFPVGDNADNWWTDIMLVQYFIRVIYLLNKSGGKSWKLSTISLGEMADLPDPHKDFKALTKTAKWIKFFQIDATLMNGFPLIANSRVEPGKNDPGNFNQTIFVINQVYKSSLEELKIEDWQNYAYKDPLMPNLLRAQLKTRITALTWGASREKLDYYRTFE